MEVEQALAAIERAKSVAELSAMLFDWRNESGVAHLVYHAVDVPVSGKPNPLLLPTYDESWVKRYLERDYFQIDPIFRAGRKGFLPIDWLTVEHDTADARHFFAEARSYGVGRHGFTLPIRGSPVSLRCSRSPRTRRMINGTVGDGAICGISMWWRSIFTIAPCVWRAFGRTTPCRRCHAANDNACSN
jgi:hypothetical protein